MGKPRKPRKLLQERIPHRILPGDGMAQLTLQQSFELALQHHQAGRLHEAEQLYQMILTRQPKHAGALHYLGMIAFQSGRRDVAVDLFRQALAFRRNYPDAHYSLGVALQGNGQIDEAIEAYRQALFLKPDFAEARNNLGNLLQAKGHLDEAIAAYRQVIALLPRSPEARNNLGNALKDKGLLCEAIAVYREALALNPGFPEAHNNLGNVLKDQGRLNEAIAAYRQALALRPSYPEAHNNLGNTLEAAGYIDQAIASYRQALALKPDFSEAHSNLGNALKDQGQMDEAIAAFRQALAIKSDFIEAHSNLAYTLHFHPACDAQTLYHEHLRWNRQHAEPLKKHIQPHTNDRSPDRGLRIGYVSPDFREHPVGRFMLPLLAHHDKTRVEVLAYSQVLVPDAITQALRSSTDAWRNIVGLSDTQAADLIRQDRIDILVDLTMHMAANRLLVFAHKPAPVQATYLAYCSTTGLDTIDYRLSDPYLDPPGGDESIYTEKTIRLPDTYWCYRPMMELPLQPPPALDKGFITFGCLNNFCKINDPLLSLWTRILRAVPRSRLLLHAQEGSHRQRLLDQLHRDGVEPQRVSFAAKAPAADYFALYQSIDLALDTFPYGGGTTTCDALWMGVPVVSLAGKLAVSRGGLSILSNIGLPQLVANTPDQYAQLAVDLARDLPRLKQLRLTLRQAMESSPLMDAPKFARGVEAAYRQMWRKWCQFAS